MNAFTTEMLSKIYLFIYFADLIKKLAQQSLGSKRGDYEKVIFYIILLNCIFICKDIKMCAGEHTVSACINGGFVHAYVELVLK